ncbi:MAG: PTS sugar transporter subunit IIA [Phycisphaerae bacterium]|nr:PTS sugar transporter subunit IIA [Phycisphaerae bacterium]
MKLADIVAKDAIIADLQAQDRDGIIKEMVEKLVAAGKISQEHAGDIIKSIVKREKQGSTGFGKGVAVPHVKHESIKSLVAGIGRSGSGIDFAALDRAPVYIVVLLLSPQDRPEEHLQAMETIFRHLQRDTFRKFLRQAQTVDQIYDLVKEAEEIAA